MTTYIINEVLTFTSDEIKNYPNHEYIHNYKCSNKLYGLQIKFMTQQNTSMCSIKNIKKEFQKLYSRSYKVFVNDALIYTDVENNLKIFDVEINTPHGNADFASSLLRLDENTIIRFELSFNFYCTTLIDDDNNDFEYKKTIESLNLDCFMINVKCLHDNVIIKANKTILIINSQPIKCMFVHGTIECTENIIQIACKSTDFLKIIDLLNCKSINYTDFDELIVIYQIAEQYGISRIISWCIEQFNNQLNIDNYYKILEIALIYKINDLLIKLNNFSLQNNTLIVKKLQDKFYF